MKRRIFLIGLIFAASLTGAGCASYEALKETRLMMGTVVEICVADRNLTKAQKQSAINKAFARMEEIEKFTSIFRQDSDVSRINNFADAGPVEVSFDTAKVIKRALELNEVTAGAFDITIAPFVNLWGFGPKGAVLKMPSDADIKEALKLVGPDKIKLNYPQRTVMFASSGVKIDLSGIAGGYAVDCAVETLKANGVKNAMINEGGDIFCVGRNSYGRPWRIGIQHPRISNRLLDKIELTDKAISTSGDYQRYFFWANRRISHIIDPRSGMPVSNVPASVTIIADDCITADGLATAIFVLGPKEGLQALSKLDRVDAIIAQDAGKKIEVYVTNGFKKS